MGIIYTGEELIRSCRRLGVIGRTGANGTLDWDILSVLGEIIWSKFVPKIMRQKEGYFVAKTRIPLVSGTTDYRLPSRAVFQKVKDAWLWDGENKIDLAQYKIEGNYIVLTEADASSGNQLELHYFFRPSSMTLAANCRQIKTITPSTKTIVLDSVAPTSWGSSFTVDVHSQNSGAEVELWDEPVTIAGDTLTCTNAIDGSVFGTRTPVVDDWVCGAGWSALPGLPQEYHPILAAAVALRFMLSIGDLKRAKALSEELGPELAELLGATEIRVEDRRRISLRGSALFPR